MELYKQTNISTIKYLPVRLNVYLCITISPLLPLTSFKSRYALRVIESLITPTAVDGQRRVSPTTNCDKNRNEHNSDRQSDADCNTRCCTCAQAAVAAFGGTARRLFFLLCFHSQLKVFNSSDGRVCFSQCHLHCHAKREKMHVVPLVVVI